MQLPQSVLEGPLWDAYVRYCKIHRTNPIPEGLTSTRFKDWLKLNGSPEAKPLHRQEDRKQLLENLTRLAPDFERRRKMFNLRLKTLLRIYLSKWFFKGLQFHEFELVEYLLDRLGYNFEFLKDRRILYNTIGVIYFAKIHFEDSLKPLDSKGWDLIELNEFTILLYNEKRFNEIWKLGSVQGLRDFIFQPFQKEEHEGKTGIKKPRIRGYRDGKASPRDLTRIRLALEVDNLFWSERYEEKLASYYDDIECYLRGTNWFQDEVMQHPS